jgi:hypothetical protein
MHYFNLATQLLDVMPRTVQFRVFEWLRKRLYPDGAHYVPDPRNCFNLRRSPAAPRAHVT